MRDTEAGAEHGPTPSVHVRTRCDQHGSVVPRCQLRPTETGGDFHLSKTRDAEMTAHLKENNRKEVK